MGRRGAREAKGACLTKQSVLGGWNVKRLRRGAGFSGVLYYYMQGGVVCNWLFVGASFAHLFSRHIVCIGSSFNLYVR